MVLLSATSLTWALCRVLVSLLPALAFAAQGTIEVLAVLALTICVGVVSQNAQKTFKLVFGFAVLGLILCVVQTLVAPTVMNKKSV